jgi:ketosteroid isomerase-like protein
MSLPINKPFAELFQAAFEAGDPEFVNKKFEQSNMHSLQKLYDVLLQGDLDSFGNRLSPGAEMEIFCPSEFRFIKRANGRDEIKKAAAHNFSILKDQQTNLLSVVAQGNTIICIGHEKGIFDDTNESYDVNFMQQFTICDDLVIHVRQIVAFSE